MDYVVKNHAPESPVIEVTVSKLGELPGESDQSVKIVVSRMENAAIFIEITDDDGNETRLVLGQEGETSLL